MRTLRSLFEPPPANPLTRRRVPPPPPELAAKVIAAARLAGADLAPRRDWIDRLWESSSARLLWTVVTCGLLFANAAATRLPTPSPPLPREAATGPPAWNQGPELADLAAEAPGLFAGVLRRGRVDGAERRRQLATLLDLGEEIEERARDGAPRSHDARARAAGEC